MTNLFRGYALIVTVDKNIDGQLPNLDSSVIGDGDLVEQILLNEDVCGYGSERITRLRAESASYENIRAEFDALHKAVGPDDPVLFYFSGHGHASSCDGSEGSSLLPWNADIDRCDNVLTSGILANDWDRIPSKRKLAEVDACYSGGIRMAKSEVALEKRLTKPQLRALSEGEGSVLFSSSRAIEPSFILMSDPTSLFTKHFANGLMGHAGHDRDGFVRVFDLFNYVAIQMRREAAAQSPVYAAYHQDRNFAVAFCANVKRRKMRTPLTTIESQRNRLQDITAVFSSLYPRGPTDEAIWERAGGDLSRLTLGGSGYTAWFRAIKLMERGGGTVTLESLCQAALLDYPRNRDLERLVHYS